VVTTPPLHHYDKSERKSFHKSIGLGIFIGFLTHVVWVGTYAFIMLVHWGDNVFQKTKGGDWFLYTIISVLTQIDMCLCVVIWIACMIMMAMLLDQRETPAVRRRFVFVSGVFYFLVGVSVGAFVALSMIDAYYLGIPIPFLLSVATVTLDLVCCYMMISATTLGRGLCTPKQDILYLV
jgi:hypothetical protein